MAQDLDRDGAGRRLPLARLIGETLMAKERLIVVGNGMAGCRAVQEVLKRDPDRYEITIFGAEPRVNYDRIMLSPVLAGEKTFADIVINDEAWYKDVFLPTVGKRGAAIIAARGLSSAASAANAAIDHMRDWALGSKGEWVTMGVPSNGEYGIPAGIVFGFPVTTENGEYKIVEGLPIDAFSQECINKTLAELEGEKDGVKHLL